MCGPCVVAVAGGGVASVGILLLWLFVAAEVYAILNAFCMWVESVYDEFQTDVWPWLYPLILSLVSLGALCAVLYIAARLRTNYLRLHPRSPSVPTSAVRAPKVHPVPLERSTGVFGRFMRGLQAELQIASSSIPRSKSARSAVKASAVPEPSGEPEFNWLLTVAETGDETCDRCGPAVRAKYRAAHPDHGSLYFCGHCGDKMMAGLTTTGWVFYVIGVPEHA
jgi:hypothetical protein